MKRLVVKITMPHEIEIAPGPPPKNGRWHEAPGFKDFLLSTNVHPGSQRYSNDIHMNSSARIMAP